MNDHGRLFGDNEDDIEPVHRNRNAPSDANQRHATPFKVQADEILFERLSQRMGPVHARQRMGIEKETETRVLDQGRHRFHPENLIALHWLLRHTLRVVGLLRRGQANSRKIQVVERQFVLPGLPAELEGYRLLHLSDTHVDMDEEALEQLLARVRPLSYDLCVLTGDYRRETWGPIQESLNGMRRLRNQLRGRALAVLGNHDSIRMVPALEDMGYELLLNEHCVIQHKGARLYIAGIDDAHFYRVDNVQRAAEGIPSRGPSLLLSHTPEIYRQAAHAGFDLFLCGHTHGGQICLPGGYPLTLDADCPRHVGKGHWRHGQMQGYTSVGSGTSIVNVRFNCPPEVTLHTLTGGQ